MVLEREATVDSNQVIIQWELVPNADSYKIYRDDREIGDIGGSNKTFTDNNVEPSTRYSYEVEACSTRVSCSTRSEILYLFTLLPKPVLSSSKVEPTQVTIQWEAIPNADRYEIYRDGMPIETDATTTYTDSSLDTSTRYNYQLRACNDDVCSKRADLVVITLLPKPVLESSVDIEATQVTIRWGAIQKALIVIKFIEMERDIEIRNHR